MLGDYLPIDLDINSGKWDHNICLICFTVNIKLIYWVNLILRFYNIMGLFDMQPLHVMPSERFIIIRDIISNKYCINCMVIIFFYQIYFYQIILYLRIF
jgi:hypothetical protein